MKCSLRSVRRHTDTGLRPPHTTELPSPPHLTWLDHQTIPTQTPPKSESIHFSCMHEQVVRLKQQADELRAMAPAELSCTSVTPRTASRALRASFDRASPLPLFSLSLVEDLQQTQQQAASQAEAAPSGRASFPGAPPALNSSRGPPPNGSSSGSNGSGSAPSAAGPGRPPVPPLRGIPLPQPLNQPYPMPGSSAGACSSARGEPTPRQLQQGSQTQQQQQPQTVVMLQAAPTSARSQAGDLTARSAATAALAAQLQRALTEAALQKSKAESLEVRWSQQCAPLAGMLVTSAIEVQLRSCMMLWVKESFGTSTSCAWHTCD